MAGFYISIRNTTGPFVDIFHDQQSGADPAIAYQPLKAGRNISFTGQIIKIDRRFLIGETGGITVCEIQVYGGMFISWLLSFVI